MRRRALLLLLLLSGACTQASPAPQPHAAKAWNMPVPSARAAEFDSRDQYALVDEIIAARGTPAGERIAALDEVRAGWESRRFRWEVALSAPLCRAGGCAVLPFDHWRSQSVIVQGWLPQLELDEAQRGELLASCALYRTCVFTVEATLRQLTLSVDQPTSLSLFEVETSGYREAGPAESWVRRRPTQRAAADPAGAPRRTLGHERSERG